MKIRFKKAFPLKDFLTEVSEGNVPGQSLVHKFGRNDAVPNGTWELISMLSGATSFLTAATTIRIKAGGDAADTFIGGAGARQITVQGIASDLTETSEAIMTSGGGASVATTTSFWRVYRAWVSSCGTYGAANTGAVIIENSGGGTDLIKIAVQEGQSQVAAYTTPTGKHGHLLSAHITVDAAKAADVRVCTRQDITDVVAPMSATRLRFYWDGIINEFVYKPAAPELSLPPLTDIWFEAEGGGAATEVSADFELLLVDD